MNGIVIARDGEAIPLTLSDRLRPPGVGFGVGWIHVYPATIYGDQLEESERVAAHTVRALGLRDRDRVPAADRAPRRPRDRGRVRGAHPRRADGRPRPRTRSASTSSRCSCGWRSARSCRTSSCTPRFRQPLAIRFLTAEPGPLPTGRVTRDRLARQGARVSRASCRPTTYLAVGETIRPVRLDGDRRGYVIAIARHEPRGARARRGGRAAWSTWRSSERSAHRRSSARATTRWPTPGRHGRRDHGRPASRLAATARRSDCPTVRDVVELGCGERHGRDARARAALSPDRRRPLGGAAAPCARSACRSASFVHGDLTALELRRRIARCGVRVLRAEPRAARAARRRSSSACTWLRPGRLLLATLGASDLAGWQGEWLGVPMFFSSCAAGANSRAASATRVRCARDEVVTIASRKATCPVPVGAGAAMTLRLLARRTTASCCDAAQGRRLPLRRLRPRRPSRAT